MKMTTILLVEDEVHLRRFYARRLQREGYQVDPVPDGLTALHHIQARRYDLILLDLLLPDISGVDVLKTIRDKSIHTPVFLVTGFLAHYNPDLRRLEEEGVCFRIMEKPVHLDNFLNAVRSVVQEAT